MPTTDICEPKVRRALNKAGWSLQSAPYTIRIDRTHSLFVDIDAQHDAPEQRILIEVKCFSGHLPETLDVYIAISQYMTYRSWLLEKRVAIPLFLALPTTAYNGVIDRLATPVIADNDVKLMVVDLKREEIVLWRR